LSAGFLYGLGAAVAFALADPGAAFLSRRMGALTTTLLVAVAGLPLVLLGSIIYGEPLTTTPGATLYALILGVGACVSYVGLYYGFAIGPLAVVGPITATFGTVTVIFAVVFLGERLTVLDSAAVVIAAAGSILAALEFQGFRRIRITGWGPASTMGAVVLGSAVSVLMQHPLRTEGWVPTVTAVRAGVGLTAGLALVAANLGLMRGLAMLGRQSTRVRLSSRFVALIAGVGVADAIALSSFSIGLSEAPAWLVALVAATSPIVLLVGGLFVLNERLRPLQWVGVGCVFCSMAIITLG
jgi:drug/metabolite transporter (DMT)-like permease